MFQPRLDVGQLNPLIDSLEQARREIHALAVSPMLERWLRRQTEIRGAHTSTRIEGNPLTEQEVRQTLARPPADPDHAQRENLDYRDAARFARQAGNDPYLNMDGGLIRALHFLTVRTTDGYGTAGQYRTEQNAVRSGRQIIYLPPHPTQVPPLMDDLVRWLRERRGQLHPLILAAVSHVEFVGVHPFDDGNGRTARAITLYFAVRGGWGLRGFVPLEDVFGSDAQEYYGQLQAVQGPRYPGQAPDLTGWVEWFLQGLLREAALVIRSVQAYGETLAEAEQAYAKEGDPERLAQAIVYVALFGSVTASDYAREAHVSRGTAVTDLRRLVDLGLIRRIGAGRATRYEAAQPMSRFIREDLRRGGTLEPTGGMTDS